MIQNAFIALAAGLASTLLFASVASGSPMSILLFNLAPLPILIAGIGWSHAAALGAAIAAAAALAAMFGGQIFISFLIGVGLPAWWLAYLALLARAGATAASAPAVEWYPVGRIVLWSALVSTLVVVIVMLTVASDEETLRDTLRNSLTAVMRGARADIDPANRGPFMQLLFDEPHRVLPAAAAVLTTIMQVFTLWLAARIVRTSGRLRRPWPAIAEMRFPPRALMLLGGAFLVSMLPGLVGIAGSIATAAVLSAYALLGLAIIHALTRPLGARGFILGGLYAGIMVIGWPMLLMTILGIADNWLDLRARLPRTSPPAPLDRT